MASILIAPDKFKGSLTAREVCQAVAEGLKKTKHTVTAVPLADGGEGTCSLLTQFSQGTFRELSVCDPLHGSVIAEYGLSKDGQTAFIEMAAASGLQLLPPAKRNPLLTTSYGTGQLIKNALDCGVTKIVLGIGGSATNDAGTGMAAALGYEFFDDEENLLEQPSGKDLIKITTVLHDKIHPRLKETEFITLCDVSNPLYGPQGAAVVYAPQKGADGKAVQLLDEGLRHFEKIASEFFRVAANFPGAGAAGGAGAGTKVFLHSNIAKGISYMISATGLEEKIQEADIVITGEGKIDEQSLSGKVVMEVSRLATRYGKPVLAICGVCALSPEALKKAGIGETIALSNEVTTSEEAMSDAYHLIKTRIASHFKD